MSTARWDVVIYRETGQPLHRPGLYIWQVIQETNQAVRLGGTTRIVVVPMVPLPCADR